MSPALPDPLSPAQFVPASETLLWEGRPASAMPATRVERALRLVGVLMLACFALVAAIGWANRDEMEGAAGFLIGFLVLTGGTAAFFLWGIQAVGRAARARTRYGVTDTQALIVHGLGGRRVTRIRPASDRKVHVTPLSPALSTVTFGVLKVRTRTRRAGSAVDRNVDIDRPLRFEGLEAVDATAAVAALRRIEGVPNGPLVGQSRA